eukprot:6195118-Pleurochrysis_carterae.AAC.3
MAWMPALRRHDRAARWVLRATLRGGNGRTLGPWSVSVGRGNSEHRRRASSSFAAFEANSSGGSVRTTQPARHAQRNVQVPDKFVGGCLPQPVKISRMYIFQRQPAPPSRRCSIPARQA